MKSCLYKAERVPDNFKMKGVFMIEFNLTRSLRHVLSALILFSLMLTAGCGSESSSNSESQPAYGATVEEGRLAANETLQQTGASSISVGFFADGRIVWTEDFGFTGAGRKTAPAPDTMFGIGSVSKMFAAVATMILVDQGKVNLDEPVKTYIPEFSMLSPEYEQVTVRMLLNHSSGFPGSEYRNSQTVSPMVDYLDQLIDSLKNERLKHAPGYLQTYCNDGFSLLEKLIENISGEKYAQFVQDEILDPLEMGHSRYALSYFPDDSYARSYTSGVADPQVFANPYASAGMNTTHTDMLRFLMMFVGKGKSGDTRILSESSVAAMGTDQTPGKFSPVINEGVRFGLGWDTVTQPAFKVLGIRAWEKGGDISEYGADMIVLPDEGMTVFVAGTRGVGSSMAKAVAERILLRALVEKGRIAAFPQALPMTPKDIKTPTQSQLDDITGYFANPSRVWHIQKNPDSSIKADIYSGDNNWSPAMLNLKLRTDGLFSSDSDPLTELCTVSANLRTYLIVRRKGGNGHYQDDMMLAEKISPKGTLSTAWSSRIPLKWLVVNESLDSVSLEGLVKLGIEEITGLEGLLCVSTGSGTYSMLDPTLAEGSDVDKLASVKLFLLPQAGRDVNDLFIFTPQGETGNWARFGSNIYRPLESVTAIATPEATIIIGAGGYDEWRKFDGAAGGSVSIISSSPWIIRGPDLKLAASGKSTGSAVLPAVSGNYYLQFSGKPGDFIMVEVS